MKTSKKKKKHGSALGVKMNKLTKTEQMIDKFLKTNNENVFDEKEIGKTLNINQFEVKKALKNLVNIGKVVTTETPECTKARKNNPDTKELMAMLLIQHNLLHGKVWTEFHDDIHKVVKKYLPHYKKGLNSWFEKGKINNNI